MATVAVSPACLIGLITELIEIPVNAGPFRYKEDCSNLARRVGLLTQFLEETSDSSPPPESNECDWWTDLVLALQAAKGVMYSASSFEARKSYDLATDRRMGFNFNCVTWNLEKALGNVPFDQYDISVEAREQVELARSQLRRAKQRYGTLNFELYSKAQSQPVEKYAFSNTRTKVSDEKKLVSSPRKSSSVSLAFFLSKEAEDERLEKELEDSKKSIPVDFLCPISLELMKDPVIVSTGQTYEKSYIQRWIECGNLTCPKTQQILKNITLTPNYVLKSLISQWCTKHNIEQPSNGDMNGWSSKNRDRIGDMSEIHEMVRWLLTGSVRLTRTALTELLSLSKRSGDNRILIAGAGAIPVLVNLLTSNDNETQEKAVACVLNLSINEHNKELIMSARDVTSLVQVLRAGSMEAKENSAATLFNLSLAEENKIIIGQSGAITSIVKLLENGSDRGKKYAASALFNLCVYQGNKGRAVGAGIVNPLVKILTDSSQSLVDEALTILSVLASSQNAKDAIWKANAIPPLVDCLHKEPRNRENAAAILLWLCKSDTEKLISIGRLGAVVSLMKLSRDGTERAQRKAKSLLELLCQAA